MIGVISDGGLGVSFFFTLSGFLITYLIIEEKELTGNFSVVNFYVRRILRIWPVYYTVLFFSFFVYPWVKGYLGYADLNPFSFFSQIFFLSNFDNIRIEETGLIDVAPMMISINWSIAVEEQFYLFWPLIFIFAGQKRFGIVICFLIAISWFCRNFLLQSAQLYYHTFSVMSDLSIGALVAYTCFYKKSFVAVIQRLHPVLIMAVYSAGFYFLMYPEVFSGYFSRRIVTSVFFAFIILEQNYAARSFYKFKSSKLLTSMGKYTYSFYLIHPIGIQVSILIFRFLNIEWDDGFQFALFYALVAFVSTMVLSFLSYNYIELFFLNKKQKFTAVPMVLESRS